VTDDQPRTALLVIDPYNDCISVGGQFWGRPKTLYQHLNHEPQTGRQPLTGKALQRQDRF
jgi:hypothetical protein